LEHVAVLVEFRSVNSLSSWRKKKERKKNRDKTQVRRRLYVGWSNEVIFHHLAGISRWTNFCEKWHLRSVTDTIKIELIVQSSVMISQESMKLRRVKFCLGVLRNIYLLQHCSATALPR